MDSAIRIVEYYIVNGYRLLVLDVDVLAILLRKEVSKLSVYLSGIVEIRNLVELPLLLI